MLKFIQNYKFSSVTTKAAVWYTFCNILQKFVAFLIIPFLTRILTQTEYGLYSVFLSWSSILEIFVTLKIYSNGYVTGLIKNKDDQNNYTCSVQFISIIIMAFCLMTFLLFSNQICSFVQIEKKFILYMFISFFSTSSIGIWSSRQRVNNKYKLMVFVTLLFTILSSTLSLIVSYFSKDKLGTVIFIKAIVQLFVSIPFFTINLFGAKKRIIFYYCKNTLSYNIPLIPYYLSMVVLNSSDRIMIKNLVGATKAGIYSVAYSLAMAVFVFVGALNLSFQPWIFNKLKTNQADGAAKTITLASCFIAILNIFVLIISPELIRIVTSTKYTDAIWIMPPVICSLLVMFIYQQIINIHFYFGKTKIIFVASIIAASINLILNYIFINMYGYIAAGYTTLASYSVILILYIITMIMISKNNNIDYKDYYNIPLLFFILFTSEVLAVIITFLYPYPFIRYGTVLTILIFGLLFRNKIINLFKIKCSDKRK